MDGPRTITLTRQNGAFGFTLRHFIVYPPDVHDPVVAKKLANCGLADFSQPMDTVFVKRVIPQSEAEFSGLREGDRLIAVNGIPVSLQFQFADIVATIQKTPKSLQIQIVPKCYDILQTFFSETAYNPETNQRPQAQVPARSGAMPLMMSKQPGLASVAETKQEALYSSLVPVVNSNRNLIFSGHNPKMAIVQPRVLQNTMQYPTEHQQMQAFKGQQFSSPISSNQEVKDVILSRLRHQIEQKEEFLKRPNKPLVLQEQVHKQNYHENNVSQNRLKPDWPEMKSDYAKSLDSMRQQQGMSQELSEIQSSRNALREQFFKDRNSTSNTSNNAYFSLPTSPFYVQEHQPHSLFIGSSNSVTEGSTLDAKIDDNRHNIGSSPIPSQGLHIVSERTKQFESGRPLSPDGIDRTSLYTSELSRINTKQVASNVALRRQVFESKACSEFSSWRCSTDDKIKDENDVIALASQTRSLSAESLQVNEAVPEKLQTSTAKKERPKPVRENSYLTAVRKSPDAAPVTLRPKSQLNQRLISEEDDRKTRRTSYLKATANEEFYSNDADQNSTLMTPDDEDPLQMKSLHTRWTAPRFTVDIQFLKRIFEENQVTSSPAAVPINDNISNHASHASKSKALAYFRDNSSSDVNVPIAKQGLLQVKVTLINGRKSQDRAWRSCNAELKRNILKLTTVREGKVSQSPDSNGGTIDLTNFDVSDGNYTKRKNVFRLSSAHYPASCDNECELLLQTQSQQDMTDWMSCLRAVSRLDSDESRTNDGAQKAEPQTVAALESVQASTLSCGEENPSPLPSKTQRKYHFGSRSPSGQSPVTKSRKAPQNLLMNPSALGASHGSDKETNSPKQKSWKHFVTNQFKKIQNTSESSSLHDNLSECCPLSRCTPSEENFYVPLIVAKCTKIVETKGLNIVGIYRIPGNTAAISTLNELINRNGLDEQTLTDSKWDDVNVVSSLLKLFIRSLPEPILPNELYGSFIEADKIPDQAQRFHELKVLIHRLPQHNYETLKHLIEHLTNVSSNASVNLMEPRNLAIVFGPSIVRKSNDSLEMVVKDMRHQCQIVESLISNFGYFFENDLMPKLKHKNFQNSNDSGTELPSADFLLENVAKIEPLSKESHKESSSRFVANIVQAANRKIRKTAQRRSTSTSLTPDTLSLDSMTTSAESRDLNKNKKALQLKSNESLADTPRSSEDDFDSAFIENGENGLSSLTATVTALLDNKLRSLRNSSVDSSDKEDKNSDQSSSNLPMANPRLSVISRITHMQPTSRPLTLGENIPFADESPERPLIQARVKPIRHSTNNSSVDKSRTDTILEKQKNEDTSSDETDSSTTSNHRERMRSVIRLEDSVLRKVNRILTNLEHLERKYSLNRSLSLNYKNNRSNNECCCNANKSDKNRLSLTKDEKTDKNINKRRQLYDTTNSSSLQISVPSGNAKYRRHSNGSRSIRRRHTVGGTHDRVMNCQSFIGSSNTSQ